MEQRQKPEGLPSADFLETLKEVNKWTIAILKEQRERALMQGDKEYSPLTPAEEAAELRLAVLDTLANSSDEEIQKLVDESRSSLVPSAPAGLIPVKADFDIYSPNKPKCAK